MKLMGLTVIAGRPGMGVEVVAEALIARAHLSDDAYLLFDLSDDGSHIITPEEAAHFRVLQREKSVPVILLSNLSRRTEEEVKDLAWPGESVPASTIPRKSDLPSNVYDFADRVLLVYRESYYRVSRDGSYPCDIHWFQVK
ncbi:MAG: hypothetical protein MR698_11890 [Selenomonas sp.]|nr:hypothetical protein [Selenomonas sp.]